MKINMNLPEKIKLNGYSEIIEFSLTDKRLCVCVGFFKLKL